MDISPKERDTLRTLARRTMETANLPVMKERRDQWKATKDLKPSKPPILVETCMLADYIGKNELQCRDPYLRNIEKSLFETLRHAEEIGDDIVIDPYFRIPWVVHLSNYGVSMEPHHAFTSSGGDLGYSFDFGVKSAEDIENLHLRSRLVDRRASEGNKAALDDIFGDILPVKLGGFDWFNKDPGYHPWLGNIYCGLTMDLFKMTGNDNLLLWVYDKPDWIHAMMKLIRDDRIHHLQYLETEGLLYHNTDTWNPCPCSYGFVSDLPDAGADGGGTSGVKLSDCWLWIDSQESEPVSPGMLDEFFLPYMAEVCALGGLVYYGCCEGLDDRFEQIEKKIPNLRAVSVSGWNDLFKMGEMIDKKYVYSRKPVPAYISGTTPDWDRLKKDIKDTLAGANNCSLEFCYRDIYTVNGDRKRLSDWVRMVRSMIGE